MAIPQKSLITEVDFLPGEEVNFTIGDPRWIMQMLADLYSNKEQAVAREYSTNARDSHIEAGKEDVPIQVSLPNFMNPYFVVEDFGIGMSEYELKNIYTSFGDSTKRNSNDYNGMLGVGSKSAIAYTEQFTVTARKDGIETIGVVSRKPDYNIVLKTVSKRTTTEPNGVKISIPVHNHAEFTRKAQDFYRFWMPGTVLVDGKEPVQAVGEKINDNLYFSAVPGVSYVVMGNVGYRIANPEALFRNAKMNSVSFVAYVDTCDCDREVWETTHKFGVGGEEYAPHSAIEFTPSREDLKYTEHTKNTLHKVISDFEDNMMDTAKTQIEKAPTHVDAWKSWIAWCDRLGNQLFGGMIYKGLPLTNSIPFDSTIKVQRYSVGGGRYNVSKASWADTRSAQQSLFIKNFTTEVTAGTKRKAREYLNLKGMNYGYVYFIPADFNTPWIPQENIVSWDNLKAAIPKAPPKPRAPRSSKPKGTFDWYELGRKHYDEELPKDNRKLFYVTATDRKKYALTVAVLNLNEDIVVVVLAANRIAKFIRENPNVKNFIDYAQSKVVTEAQSLVDQKTKDAMNLNSHTKGWIEALDSSKIDDPMFKELEELVQHREFGVKYDRNLELARSVGKYYDVKQLRFDYSSQKNPVGDAYPLLDSLNRYSCRDSSYHDEVIFYINARYAQKGSKP